MGRLSGRSYVAAVGSLASLLCSPGGGHWAPSNLSNCGYCGLQLTHLYNQVRHAYMYRKSYPLAPFDALYPLFSCTTLILCVIDLLLVHSYTCGTIQAEDYSLTCRHDSECTNTKKNYHRCVALLSPSKHWAKHSRHLTFNTNHNAVVLLPSI